MNEKVKKSCIFQCLKIRKTIATGPENSDFNSGLAVLSRVVKSGEINITETCKNLGLMKPGC